MAEKDTVSEKPYTFKTVEEIVAYMKKCQKQGLETRYENCPDCDGSGQYTCEKCKGLGRIKL